MSLSYALWDWRLFLVCLFWCYLVEWKHRWLDSCELISRTYSFLSPLISLTYMFCRIKGICFICFDDDITVSLDLLFCLLSGHFRLAHNLEMSLLVELMFTTEKFQESTKKFRNKRKRFLSTITVSITTYIKLHTTLLSHLHVNTHCCFSGYK